MFVLFTAGIVANYAFTGENSRLCSHVAGQYVAVEIFDEQRAHDRLDCFSAIVAALRRDIARLQHRMGQPGRGTPPFHRAERRRWRNRDPVDVRQFHVKFKYRIQCVSKFFSRRSWPLWAEAWSRCENCRLSWERSVILHPTARLYRVMYKFFGETV